MSVNVCLRELDVPLTCTDSRRLEIVAGGVPLFGGAQLAVDTLVFPIRGDGRPRHSCDVPTGVGITEAERKKLVDTCPELSGTGGRAHLGVWPLRWAADGHTSLLSFVCQPARAKFRSEPRVLTTRARQGWHHHWCTLLACATSRAWRPHSVALCPLPSDSAV